jgi:membrane associated rhomboid family serine protease
MNDPKWLTALIRRLDWLAIPNLALYFVVVQALGFLFCTAYPQGPGLLALFPGRVLDGELWRLVSFVAMPLSFHPLWVLFALSFLYFVLQALEQEWGEAKTTLYVLISLGITVAFSFLFAYPVTGISDFSTTLFLAAAALFPNYEIRIYFFIPVKMKILGWLALAFLLLRLIQGDWLDRAFLLAIYSNYLLFFGPSWLARVRDWKRRRDFRARYR